MIPLLFEFLFPFHPEIFGGINCFFCSLNGISFLQNFYVKYSFYKSEKEDFALKSFSVVCQKNDVNAIPFAEKNRLIPWSMESEFMNGTLFYRSGRLENISKVL
ncbi:MULTISPECIES: hypothetical protein [Bacteroides]|jgi:hypothetical protein|uniref:hypothetical protein n=1 Tax=Bacteroides TaxID=816 RepID=UPI0011C1CD85|nr:hypothetical protein [Bacteroides ovatus]